MCNPELFPEGSGKAAVLEAERILGFRRSGFAEKLRDCTKSALERIPSAGYILAGGAVYGVFGYAFWDSIAASNLAALVTSDFVVRQTLLSSFSGSVLGHLSYHVKNAINESGRGER